MMINCTYLLFLEQLQAVAYQMAIESSIIQNQNQHEEQEEGRFEELYSDDDTVDQAPGSSRGKYLVLVNFNINNFI